MIVNVEFGYHAHPYHTLGYHSAHVQGALGVQFLSTAAAGLGVQVFHEISGTEPLGVQFRPSFFTHTECNPQPYHAGPYHATPYHQAGLCAALGVQFESISEEGLGVQFRAAIYNTTNLRIMCSFPSRGNDGINWTASSTEASTTSSFTVNNLNTDIVEQIWRSATGTKVGIVLDQDSQAGNTIFLDTFAMLNHNLTTSATVNLLGSDNVGHAPTGVTIPLTMTEGNFVYIAPTLPVAGYRYWRITIDDNTNSNDFISIGTVVFGAATIFNDECFVDKVVKSPINFADSVFTEAFTNIQNDRGIKNKVKLEFRNIRFNGGNFGKLVDDVFQAAGIILKCLWVPTPEFPLRFMTFAKLTKIPQENHNVKGENLDFVNFTIETDESL